jgi:hypothetical protein
MSLVCLTYSTIITIHLRYSRGSYLQVYGQILFDRYQLQYLPAHGPKYGEDKILILFIYI